MKKNNEEIDDKMKEFSDLLDSLQNLEDKKKMLWREIYNNAVIDRMNAYMLFTDVYTTMQGGTNDHIQLGTTMSRYIERMNKANDQLLKLAELIGKEDEKSAKIDPDDMFSKIQEK